MNDIKSRLIQLIENKGISKREFCRQIEVSPTFLANKSEIASDKVLNIITAFPDVNVEWLLTGDGEMLKTPGDNSDPDDAFALVPVYNFDAVGSMNKSNDVTDSPAYIERYVPFPGARKDDMCVHVTGNSMIPTHCPGSLLLVREVQDWREYFGYGHCFVIFLRDGRRILKEVQRFADNPKEYIMCVSHNREYPEEELPKNMITAVYKVIMTLTNEGF